jgi:DNA-binding MarR family transcriptional regulator
MPVDLSRDDATIWELIDAAYLAVNQHLLRGLHAAGFSELRPAHAKVFENYAAGARTVSAIAERAQMTKQAMGELVGHLEAWGYVTRVPDPADRRARQIEMTERGQAAMRLAWAGMATLTADLEQALHASGVAGLRAGLLAVLELTDGS